MDALEAEYVRSGRSWQILCEAVAAKVSGIGFFYAKELTIDLVTTPGFIASDLLSWAPIPRGGRKGLNVVYGRPVQDGVDSGASSKQQRFLHRLRVLSASLWREDPMFMEDHALYILHDIEWVLCEVQKYSCPQHMRPYVPRDARQCDLSARLRATQNLAIELQERLLQLQEENAHLMQDLQVPTSGASTEAEKPPPLAPDAVGEVTKYILHHVIAFSLNLV